VHPFACRGKTNEFEVDDEELGELLEITIGHDGTSACPSWHLDHVVILNTKTDQKFVFPCRCGCWAAAGQAQLRLDACIATLNGGRVRMCVQALASWGQRADLLPCLCCLR